LHPSTITTCRIPLGTNSSIGILLSLTLSHCSNLPTQYRGTFPGNCPTWHIRTLSLARIMANKAPKQRNRHFHQSHQVQAQPMAWQMGHPRRPFRAKGREILRPLAPTRTLPRTRCNQLGITRAGGKDAKVNLTNYWNSGKPPSS
jgi:hypothetical protein